MTTSKTALVAVVAASLGLASCETGPTNEDIGFLLGAAAGGLIGSQFGSGSGQLAFTALGAVLGGFAGRAVARRLTRQDHAYMNDAAYRAVDTGQPTSWSNTETGHYGSVAPSPSYVQGNQTCRNFSQSVTADDDTSSGTATACQLPDGSWQIRQT